MGSAHSSAPVRRRNISSEFLIGALQFVAESVHKAEGSADLLSDVAEHFEAQRVLFSAVERVSSGFSGLIATSDAPAAVMSGSIFWNALSSRLQ